MSSSRVAITPSFNKASPNYESLYNRRMDSISKTPYLSSLLIQAVKPDQTFPDRRRSSGQSSCSTVSNLALPSPSVVAARAFYLGHASPIGRYDDEYKQRGNSVAWQQSMRRDSLASGSASLRSQLENFTFKRGTEETKSSNESEKVSGTTVDEKQRIALHFKNEKFSDLREHAWIARRLSDSILYTPSEEILSKVPFLYTHRYLRDWGHAYFGNVNTSDAFVNAVSLRRPSLALAKKPGVHSNSTSLVMIRARVLPRAKERRPFLIQRQFDIEELRKSIPTTETSPDKSELSTSPALRRSTRTRRSQVQNSVDRRSSLGQAQKKKIPMLGKGAVPIHIEYALHFLPVLGALMLSGHIRKGDTIDLPLPQPESWQDTVAFIYSGKTELTPAIQENILYLAGSVS